MRSSSLVLSSLVLVLFLSGFAGRGPVIGSEAGLTAGTPVLTAAELKALAPDPMPVVEDPQTEIKVTLKPLAAAEAAAARAATPKPKKAKASGEIVLSLKDEPGDEVEARPKKAPARKDAKKSDKKTDVAKKDSKKSDKKTTVAKKDAKKSDKKTAVAKKDSKKSDKKTAVAKKPDAAKKKTEVAKKPATKKPAAKKPVQVAGAAKFGKTRVLPEDLPAEKAIDEESDEEGDEGDEVEPVALKPAKKTVVAAKAKASKPAKATKPAVEEAAEAAAPAPAPVDPTVIADADAATYREKIVAFLAKAGAPEAGGSVSAKLASMKRGTLNYKPVVLVEGAKIHAVAAKFQNLFVKKATMELRDLAFDEAQLKGGACVLVGKPTLVPDFTLEHRQVQEKVAKNNVRNPKITYEGNQMHFAGEVKVMFFKINFRMAGRFERHGNNVSFRIAELLIRNSPAGADRLASTQAKMENMIKLEDALAPLGAPGAPVRGGRLSIEDGDSVVYTTALDVAVLAE